MNSEMAYCLSPKLSACAVEVCFENLDSTVTSSIVSFADHSTPAAARTMAKIGQDNLVNSL